MAQQGGAQVVGNQIVGNIGMYYAAYRLSQQGWNVMPTARNARGVDLLVYDVRAHIYKGIQVKALSKRIPVPLGNTLDRLMGDWWIIVTNAGTTNPVCFMQVNRHRLASRDCGDGVFFDISLLSIDEIVSRNNTSRKCGIALQQGFDRVRDLLVVGPAHIQNLLRKLLQV